MKKIRAKTHEELKALYRANKIQLLHVSDDGECYAYCTRTNPGYVFRIFAEDMGKEYLVVEHPRPISDDSYKDRRIFFEELTE